MSNVFNDEEENIRLPDAVITEQLLEDNRSEYEKQIDEAIYISYQELSENQELNKKYEEQLLKDYKEESDKRRKIFETLLFDLHKISKIDREVREIYEIVDPIIESYCSQYIDLCELDADMHKKIFTLLSKIRTDKTAVNFLKDIIKTT